jgi:hypothetical protein
MKLGRIHIVPSELRIFVAIVATMFAIQFACPGDADAATFPYYNLEGYKTTLYLVNTTNANVSTSVSGLPVNLGPNATYKVGPWPSAGGSVANFAVPAGVSAFVEITDPNGSSVRFPEVTPYATAQVFGLTTDANQRAEIFIASSGYVELSFYKDAELLTKYQPNMTGDVAIEVAPAEANRAVVSSVNFSFGGKVPGPVYLYGFHRQTTGGYKIQNPIVGVPIVQVVYAPLEVK